MAEHRLQRTREAYAEDGIPDTHWYAKNAHIADEVDGRMPNVEITVKWVKGDMTPSDLADLLAGD